MFAASKSGSAADPTDPQFNYVTMLLHGDGTNGSQNNTFVDSSTNNFTITRNGNTTQGTFTPYGSNWSNYFGIATSDLKFASNAAFGVGTGNFSIEFFVNISEWAGHQRFFMTGDSGLDAIQLGRPFADSIGLDMNNGRIITYSWVPNIGQWYHIALVRSGTGANQIALYIDGVSVATGTSSYSVPAKDAFVGGNDWNTDRSCRGYISNMRFSNIARTITVPTSAYTSDANTLILTCQSNRFIDNSSNGFPAIAQGSPSVQRFSPFSPTTAYSTSVIGGSGYFDGSGDRLTVPANAAFNFSTGDFTVELWFYANTVSGNQWIVGPDNTVNYPWVMQTVGTAIRFISNNAANDFRPTSFTLATGTWNHFAVTRSGSTMYWFTNGTLNGTQTYSNSIGSNTIDLQIGTTGSGSGDPTNGYVTDLRVVKGTAVYTSSFTPSTAPVTAITNTSLLLSYTNAGIFDNAMMNDLETVGNAQISTSVKKYGTGSIYLDGTGDYLYSIANQTNNFGAGSFTVECWVYFASVGNAQLVSAGSGSNTNAYYWQYFSSQLQFGIQNVGNITAASWTPTANTWYHLAVVRSGTNVYQFVDGTQLGTTATSSHGFVDGPTYVGFGGAGYLNGYIDDLRISKGLARYTANFTAPTTAFADKG